MIKKSSDYSCSCTAVGLNTNLSSSLNSEKILQHHGYDSAKLYQQYSMYGKTYFMDNIAMKNNTQELNIANIIHHDYHVLNKIYSTMI